jgi:putative SOS response-associated peptidase YedK
MPAILGPLVRERWIDPGADAGSLLALLGAGAGPARLEACEVSRLVNNVANDSPECIRPA